MRILRTLILASSVAATFISCEQPILIPAPTFNTATDATEAEYGPYLKEGSGMLIGQAFMTQRGGTVVKGAGRNVTLDPVTTVGNEWWGKAGKVWIHRNLVPSSPNFLKARRTIVADGDGRFKFANLPAGKYFVRTEVTWFIGDGYPTQGGLVGQIVEITEGKVAEVVLNVAPI